jgi:hypothetical protein
MGPSFSNLCTIHISHNFRISTTQIHKVTSANMSNVKRADLPSFLPTKKKTTPSHVEAPDMSGFIALQNQTLATKAATVPVFHAEVPSSKRKHKEKEVKEHKQAKEAKETTSNKKQKVIRRHYYNYY